MDQSCSNRILSEDYADFIIESGSNLDAIKANLDICYDDLDNKLYVVYTPIANLPGKFIHLFGYKAYPKCYGLTDIPSLEQSGVTKIRNIPSLNLYGQGVLIGLVDTGIEYTHAAFKNADNTTRILSIWDQSIENEASRPEGFYYGTEYTKELLNTALNNSDPYSIVPSTDTNGHGTALAGIAAGNASEENNFSGVVPNAELVVVKLKQAKKFIRDFWKIPEVDDCYQQNDIMLGIKFLLQKADEVGKPISIIIGLGTSQGSHDERGTLAGYLSRIAMENGRSVSISAGNEGNSRHHYYGKIQQGNKYDTMELNVGPNESGFTMELWGKAPNTFSIDITSPSGEYIARIPARLNENQIIRFIFGSTVINLDYQIVESQTGDQLILLRFTEPEEGIWRFRVYLSGNLSSDYHTWLPIQPFISTETYFVRSNPNTTLTSPGNTFIPIVATAYDYSNNSLYSSAGRGYTRNENISPTIAAPGVNMIAPALNQTYSNFSGTSIAAAHTAGVAAMLLEWGIVNGKYPQIGTVEIRNFFIRGAIRNPSLTYPNRDWGYGILDLYNSFINISGESE